MKKYFIFILTLFFISNFSFSSLLAIGTFYAPGDGSVYLPGATIDFSFSGDQECRYAIDATITNGYFYRNGDVFLDSKTGGEFIWNSNQCGLGKIKLSEYEGSVKLTIRVRSITTGTYFDQTWVRNYTIKKPEPCYVVGSGRVTCSFTEIYIVGGSYNPTWIVDPNVAEIVEGQSSHNVKIRFKSAAKSTIIKATYGGYLIGQLDVRVDPNYTIQSSTKLACKGNLVTYKIPVTLGDESTIYWAADRCLALVQGQGTSATFIASGNGPAIVRAEITAKNKKVTVVDNSVWVGVPEDVSDLIGFEDNREFSPNSTYTFRVFNDKAGNNYTWNAYGGTILSKNGPSITVRTKNVTSVGIGAGPEPFGICVYASNVCGQSFSPLIKEGFIYSGYYDYLESPMSENESEKATSIQNLEVDNLTCKSIRIYSVSGLLVYSRILNGQYLDIKSLGLNSGIYIVERIGYDGNIEKSKILLNNQ